MTPFGLEHIMDLGGLYFRAFLKNVMSNRS